MIMKTTLKTLGILFSLWLLAFSASALVIFQDNFDGYPDGVLTNSTWQAGAGNTLNSGVSVSGGAVSINASGASQPRAYFTNGIAGFTVTNFNNGASNVVYYFGTNTPIAGLYFSYTLNVSSATNSYHAYFADTNFSFVCRIYATTNTATPGSFRIGVGNTTTLAASNNLSSVATNIIQQDLAFGNTYTIVGRYLPASGLCSVWVNPGNENDASASATFGAPFPRVSAFGLRANTGTASPPGTMTLDNLIVGTTFADVVPASAGANPPFFAIQPQDVLSAITNDTVTFTSLAGGDDPLSYQWFSVTNSITNSIVGATSSNLTLTAVTTNLTGFYFVVATNIAGTNSSRLAQLIVYPAPESVTITNQPQSQTLNVGDTATFSVLAGGVPPPTYQWFVVTNNGVTFKTNIIASANTPTLTLNNIATNLNSWAYFVTVSNRVGATNSAKAVLTVNPVATLTIAQFRSMVDGSFNPTNTTSVYTIQGTVTTWTNMTTSSASTEFYMQDNTAGIAVFWSGAPKSTNIPPAGAIVNVTGPMATFDGLIEIEPVFTNTLHKVTVLSTGNPLPTPQPLPFDPNVAGNLAAMKAMESTYFVASNVTLAAGTTFGSGVNEPITANASNVLTAPMFGLTFTNLQGQTFTLFINGATDIPGQAKPAGPVTIYGVLGYFNTAGFEFTPSRYADIISYLHVTNQLSNLVRPGDQPTNTFTESFLLPGETLTTFASIGDAAGGNVTLTPLTGGLPASAGWSDITGGQTARAVFHFTPTTADAGSNYVVSLVANSTSGNQFTNTFTVYVPTADEQRMCISEILANPTTNTAWPNFNPLHRATDTIGVVTNDQYIELVNLSADNLASGWTVDKGNAAAPIFDSNATGTGIGSSNAVVIYGGDLSESPNLPVPAATIGSLSLPTSGNGVVVLRNQNSYIIDRVVYSDSALSTNSSLSRFPMMNGPFVPEAYISTNATTAGLQYDGRAWNAGPQIPTAVNTLAVNVTNKQAVLQFSAVPNQAATLWSVNRLTDPFTVIFGQSFGTSAGTFSVTNLPPAQFYYITTQTNAP